MFSTIMKISAFAALILAVMVSCAFPQQEAYSPEQHSNGHLDLVPGTHMPVRLDALGGKGSASGRMGVGASSSTYGFITINAVTEVSLSFDLHALDATGRHVGTSSYSLYNFGQTMDINGENLPVFRPAGQHAGTENAFVLTIIRDVDGEIAGWLPGGHWEIGWPSGGIQAFCGMEIVIICVIICTIF